MLHRKVLKLDVVPHALSKHKKNQWVANNIYYFCSGLLLTARNFHLMVTLCEHKEKKENPNIKAVPHVKAGWSHSEKIMLIIRWKKDGIDLASIAGNVTSECNHYCWHLLPTIYKEKQQQKQTGSVVGTTKCIYIHVICYYFKFYF